MIINEFGEKNFSKTYSSLKKGIQKDIQKGTSISFREVRRKVYFRNNSQKHVFKIPIVLILRFIAGNYSRPS